MFFIQTDTRILSPGWIPDIHRVGRLMPRENQIHHHNKTYWREPLSENGLLDISNLFRSQAALGRWRYSRANSSLSKHPSSAVHRPLPGPPHRRAGSRKPIRSQGNLRGQRASAMAAVARAGGSPGAKPLRSPLSLPEGKVAPPESGRQEYPALLQDSAHRTQDCKMWMTGHHLRCMCVSCLSPH